jgi:hypothetical protein
MSADVGPWRVIGVMLVDAVPTGLWLANAGVGVLAVAIDSARAAGLHQRRIVAAVEAGLPALLIAERDDGRPIRIDRLERIARARLGGALRLVQQDRLTVPERVDDVKVIEGILAVLVRRTVRSMPSM